MLNTNWIDIFFLILFLGMVYKGSKTGVGGQILSLAGIFVLIFVATRYYVFCSEAIFGFMLQRWSKPLSFFGIATTVIAALKIVERVFSVISTEENAAIERLGGAVVAAVRACLMFGVIGTLLVLVPVNSIHDAAAVGSRTCMAFVNVNAGIYSWITKISGIDGEEYLSGEDLVKQFLQNKDN